MLSHRLPVFGLVGRYPTNNLIGRKPVQKQLNRQVGRAFPPIAAATGVYAVLGRISPVYPPLQGRSLTCYSAVCHYPPKQARKDRSTCMH